MESGSGEAALSFFARALSASVLLFAAAICPAPTAVGEPADSGSCNPLGEPNWCVGQPPSVWPVAEGNYTSPTEPGWVFFIPRGFEGHGCGIAPDGTVGCDAVPARGPDGTPVQAGQPGPPGSYSCNGGNCPLPPPGANQIVVSPERPARYVQSDVETFTRAVDVLDQGYRLVNGDAWCSVGYQGTVSCTAGKNGFTLAAFGVFFDEPLP